MRSSWRLKPQDFCNVVSVPDGAPTPDSKEYTSKFDFMESAEQKLSGITTTYSRCR